jgi:hypothetical protein
MHKRVLAATGSLAHIVTKLREAGGHVPASTLRAYAESLERAAHRLRRIAEAKEQRPGGGWSLPNFFD